MTAILLHTDRIAPTANRGSGCRTRTRWYRVVTAQVVEGRTLIDGFNLEVANTYLGLGTRDAIAAHVDQHHPGHEVVDTWPIARPIAA